MAAVTMEPEEEVEEEEMEEEASKEVAEVGGKREANMEFLLSLVPLMENLAEEESTKLKQEVLWAVETVGQNDKERRVIRFMSECPVLWDPGHPCVGEAAEVDAAWQLVSQQSKMTVPECKTIWEALTKDFLRFLELPEPKEKWKYEEEMAFCIPYLTQPRHPEARVHFKKEDDLDIPVERVETSSILFEDDDETSPLELCQVECPDSPAASSSHQGQPVGGSGLPVADSALFEFFTNMARTTASFPPRLQAHVKAEVFRAVNSAEIELHSHLLQMDLQLQAGISQQERWRKPKPR